MSGTGVSIGRMEKTTSRKLARARLVERQQAAAADREARERANIGDLIEFTVRAAEADEVDAWLDRRIENLKTQAVSRRAKHRLAAGKALQAMRLRGESVTSIAAQTGLSVSAVRDFLRLAADAEPDTQTEAVAAEAQVVPMPNHTADGANGHAPRNAAAGAQ